MSTETTVTLTIRKREYEMLKEALIHAEHLYRFMDIIEQLTLMPALIDASSNDDYAYLREVLHRAYYAGDVAKGVSDAD